MHNSSISTQYCKRCAYPSNHALGISFSSDGLCSGCIVHEEKDMLDWGARENKLIKILELYRNKTTTNYDCIIPISGGKDSFFIVDLIKNKYGLNPLLVSFNKHYNTKGGIHNLEHIRTLLGCDIATMTLNPEQYKKLIRYSIKRLGSIHWPYLAGSTVYPVQVAVQKNIPLIIWGAHQGIDQVGMFSHTDEVEMTRRYRKEHDLLGHEPEDALLEGNSYLTRNDLAPLFYPNDSDLYSVGVRGIYLNNYIRWDTKAQHEKMLHQYEYYASQQKRTFDTYNDVDCLLYNTLHDEIKYKKFGYSKINDHVAREIRFGRLSYQEGLNLIEQYQSQYDHNYAWFLKWIDVSEDQLWSCIDEHRDPSIWQKSNEKWILKSSPTILSDTEANRYALPKCNDNEFTFTTSHPEQLNGHSQNRQFMLRGDIRG